MPKPHRNDISIGPDRWITFVDIDGRASTPAVAIDQYVSPLESFWSALETDCVAGCCGIDAFALWPEHIQAACRSQDRRTIELGLKSLRDFVEQSGADTFVSHRLNNLFPRSVLLELIKHIQRCVALSKST